MIEINSIPSHIILSETDSKCFTNTPTRLTVVNPINSKILKNVRVLKTAHNIQHSAVSLTNTSLRNLKAVAPLILPENVTKGVGSEISSPAKLSCILINEDTNENVYIANCVYRMRRHATVSKITANKYNLKNGQTVAVKVNSPRNTTTFCDMYLKIINEGASDNDTKIKVYIDTDEAGACVLVDAVSYDLYIQNYDGHHMLQLIHVLNTKCVMPLIRKKQIWNVEEVDREFKQNFPIKKFPIDNIAGSSSQFPISNIIAGNDNVKPFKLNTLTSNKHVHVSIEDMYAMFGGGYRLTPMKAIGGGMPMMLANFVGFASKEKLTIRNIETGQEINNVTILGPPRMRTQIELAYSDLVDIGLENDTPTRISGDNISSGKCILIPHNEDGSLNESKPINLKQGAVRAWRHIHYAGKEAKTGDFMTVCVESEHCTTMFHDVLVRVGSDKRDATAPDPNPPFYNTLLYYTVMATIPIFMLLGGSIGYENSMIHVDTDEGNACNIAAAKGFTLYHQNLKSGKLTYIGSTKNSNSSMMSKM
jgi:putative phosphotransacetylase